jgi:hypothetical protein
VHRLVALKITLSSCNPSINAAVLSEGPVLLKRDLRDIFASFRLFPFIFMYSRCQVSYNTLVFFSVFICILGGFSLNITALSKKNFCSGRVFKGTYQSLKNSVKFLMNLMESLLRRLQGNRDRTSNDQTSKDRTSKDWTSKDRASKDRTLKRTEHRKTEPRKGPNIERPNLESDWTLKDLMSKDRISNGTKPRKTTSKRTEHRKTEHRKGHVIV